MRYVASVVLATLVAAGVAMGQTKAATPTAEEIKKIEQALGQSFCVVAGKLEAPSGAAAASPATVLMMKVKTAVFSNQAGIGSLPLQVAAGGPAVGAEGIWFVVSKDNKFYLLSALPSLPMADLDKVVTVAGPWLTRRIEAQIKAVAAAHAADPDGDKEATWKAVNELYLLGENEMRFPAWSDKVADHPSPGHLAETYKALGMELGVPPYPRTPEEKQRALAAMAKSPEPMVGNAATRPNLDERNFNQMFNYFLYQHFSAMQATVAADDVRFKSEARDWEARLPAGTKITRMAVFKARVAMLTAGPMTRPGK